ncbi:MAG: hypothetical protein GKS01_15155 [Alphaproteobacteria bacterium]|nr:hypothetical protein [Alphaproteobacteria bacterium]
MTLDKDLDRAILNAMARKDFDTLRVLPFGKLNSGSSEIRNWLNVAGAAGKLEFDLYDYQPCYRTPAGNGWVQHGIRNLALARLSAAAVQLQQSPRAS